MNTQNQEWLEGAEYNFKDALDAEDFKTAQIIIEDVKDISKDAADRMQQEYDEAYQLYDHATRRSEDDNARIDEHRNGERDWE